MKSVWVLLIYMAGNSYNGGPIAIDNIVDREECVRVQEVVRRNIRTSSAQCIEVRKVNP